MNIDAYIDHRIQRQKQISSELNHFAYVSSVYLLFFIIMFAKHVLGPEVNCELSLIVLIVYHLVDVIRQRKFIFCRETLNHYFRHLPDE